MMQSFSAKSRRIFPYGRIIRRSRQLFAAVLIIFGFIMSGINSLYGAAEGRKEALQVLKTEFHYSADIKERELRENLHFDRKGLFRNIEIYNARSLQRSLELIARRFQAEGYLLAEAHDSLETVADNSVILHIIVDEGPVYTLAELILEGNERFSDREIRQILEPEAGAVFRPFYYMDKVQQLYDHYGNEGMPYVEINESFSDSTDLSWRIQISNEQEFRIDSLDFAGQSQTVEKLIRRELLFETGDMYDLSELRASRRRIFELGAYNNVIIEPVNADAEKATLAIRMSVSEALRRTWDMNIGVRQGRVEAVNQSYLYSQLDWRHRNLFGRAKKLKLSLSMNFLWDQIQNINAIQPSYNVELSYTEPWLVVLRLPTTFTIFTRKDIYSPFNRIVTDENDELLSSGFAISSLYRYREVLNSLLTVSLRRIDSKLSADNNELQRKVEYQLRYDNRDNFLYPSKGWNILLKSNYTETVSRRDDRWMLANASLSRYFPLWYGGSLAIRMESGMIKEISGSTPLYSLFRMGTENTVRGWSQSIGDSYESVDQTLLYAGTNKFMTNLELRQKVIGPVGMLIFLDAGNLAGDMAAASDPASLYISAGPGITYNTYIGPVRAEFPFVLQDPGGDRNTFSRAEISFILALLFAF